MTFETRICKPRTPRQRPSAGSTPATCEAAMSVTIKVNGTVHSVDVDGDTPLLWVLRDVLGVTGTKFGCGMALCGACTVHVDGVATRSCVTPVDSIGGSAITQLEGNGGRRGGGGGRQNPEGLARP